MPVAQVRVHITQNAFIMNYILFLLDVFLNYVTVDLGNK